MPDERLYEIDDIAAVGSLLERLNRQGGDYANAGAAVAAHLRTLGARFVLREERYIDRDYSRAYDDFYGGFFRPPSKFARRYHFFTSDFDPAERVTRHDPRTSADPHYLGFVVVWPTDPPIIGRTILRPPPATRMLTRTTLAHIGIDTFEIEAPPYCTKDFGVAACATVATFLATEISGPQYGLPNSSTTEITDLATRIGGEFGRPMPQRFGLTPGEICRALSALGYEPFVQDLTSFEWHAAGTIFGHLTSGIPVILMIELLPDEVPESGEDSDGRDEQVGRTRLPRDGDRHAVLAIGYDWDSQLAMDGRSWPSGMRTIYVHDDRYGPYVPVNFIGQAEVELRYTHKATRAILKQLILPLPPRTYLISHEAHRSGRTILKKIAARTVPRGTPEILVRTYLARATDLKAESADWGFDGPAADFRQQSLPQRVWISEAWEYPIDTAKDAAGRAICDATVLRDATRSHLLWAHFRDEVHDVRLVVDYPDPSTPEEEPERE